MRSNPNGANQYLVDPRQALFLNLFLDPKSKTFANTQQSALKAGYAEHYASTITARLPIWLQEKVKELYVTDKAEKNLQEFLEMDTQNTAHTSQGELYQYDDAALKRIKLDATKFTLERLKRLKYGKDYKNDGDGLTKGATINIINFDGSLTSKTDGQESKTALVQRFLGAQSQSENSSEYSSNGTVQEIGNDPEYPEDAGQSGGESQTDRGPAEDSGS